MAWNGSQRTLKTASDGMTRLPQKVHFILTSVSSSSLEPSVACDCACYARHKQGIGNRRGPKSADYRCEKRESRARNISPIKQSVGLAELETYLTHSGIDNVPRYFGSDVGW
jgi:hypothetical protein